MSYTTLFNCEFYLAALVIAVTGITFTLLQQRTDKLQNKIYMGLLTLMTLNCLSQIITVLAEDLKFSSATTAAIMRFGQWSYFIFHNMLAPVFFFYVIVVCGLSIKNHKTRYILSTIPFVVTELLVFLNPLTNWVYYYDKNMEFRRNWGEMLIYLSGAFYLALAVFMLMFSWRTLNSKRKAALIYFFCIVIAGLVIQLLNIRIRSELMAESVALLGVMISIEIEDDRMDSGMGIYNRRALISDVHTYIGSGRKLYLLCIKIVNTDIIKRATGSENTDELTRMVSEYLKTLMPRYYIYSTNPDTFMITMMDADEQKAVWLAGTIAERFEQPWKIADNDIPLKVMLMAADVPGRIKTVNDAMYMADSPVPKKTETNILTGSDLDYLLRRAAIESALTKGLKEGNFEVFYQPTYYVKPHKLHGAEALIRLHDDELGNLFPEEFIPIAEQIGLIDEVDDFVLREVCKFIKTGIPQSCNMDCINVNLSVIQCMQPTFAEHINMIVEEYDVPKNFINFEITESISANDYSVLSRMVRSLKKQGFKFSMDDYGTGYSNMQSIFRLDFDTIKIDRSILWSAEKNSLGKTILEFSVKMIQQMRRKILVEGVETEHQLDMLKELNVDYVQGFLFSKPISKRDFIALIQGDNTEPPK